MAERDAVATFMSALSAAVEAVVPAGVNVAVQDDWLMLLTSYGREGYEAAAGLDAGSSTRTIRGRVYQTLNVVQEAVVKHLAEPWPTLPGGPRPGPGHRTVWLPDVYVQSEGASISAFYGYEAERPPGAMEEWVGGDVVLALPTLTWTPGGAVHQS